MLLYVVTDRRLRLDLGEERLAAAVASCGADMVQIREKDLPAREVIAMARSARAAAGTSRAQVFVNGRPDLALAAGADGVHLPAAGLPAAAVSARWRALLRVGVSTHGVEEVREAARSGADFVVFGPVFETPSKAPYGPPLGVEGLARAVESAEIPVLAIGGVTRSTVGGVARSGAAGAAVVSAVIAAPDMRAAASELRRLWEAASPAAGVARRGAP